MKIATIAMTAATNSVSLVALVQSLPLLLCGSLPKLFLVRAVATRDPRPAPMPGVWGDSSQVMLAGIEPAIPSSESRRVVVGG